MWDSKGNIPALVRLLSSIIPRGSQYILEHNQIEPILGIFQKLVSTKANEAYGFDLLESVVANFPSYASAIATGLEKTLLTLILGLRWSHTLSQSCRSSSLACKTPRPRL
jgi:hypothetical protein